MRNIGQYKTYPQYDTKIPVQQNWNLDQKLPYEVQNTGKRSVAGTTD